MDGPLTLVFHLDPRARWQDGHPVTAADVEFTFNAYHRLGRGLAVPAQAAAASLA